MRSDGAQTVAVIASDSPLQMRFASAFNAEWILAGGAAPSLIRFDRATEALVLLKRGLGRTPPNAVLLALDSADAALVKPYLGAIATYAGSQVNDRQPREVRRDLDDVFFVDIPWLADPEAATFASYARPQWPNPTLQRLYALGIDAFRIAQSLEDGPVARLEFDGATGRLSLDASRQFVREGRVLQFRAGEIASVDGR
jgi:outer membrane PBP1 activator LpoA protein